MRTEHILHHLGADVAALALAGDDQLGALAAQRSDLPLQGAHARLADIVVNQVVQRLVIDAAAAAVEAVALNLFWHQIALGNLELFLAGIAGQLDDLHAVVQRGRDAGRVVCRREEEDVAQIERDLQIVVAEGKILLRVQHLQQRRGRVALVVAAQFVDLVQQHQRVHAARLFERGHDAAGHRADVSLAVAADVRLVAHAAQAHAHIFAAHRLGDGARNRSLADAGRAHQTDDLALDVRLQLAHRQNLQDALLDLLQAVVVGVELLLRRLDIQLILGELVPRQREDGVQIVAADHRLLAGIHHLGELVDLVAQLLLGLLVRIHRPELFIILRNLLVGVVIVAQLGVDGLELLAQVVLLLVAVHLVLHPLGDGVLDLEHLRLAVQQGGEQLQTFAHVGFLQNLLLALQREAQILGQIFG